MPAVEYFTAKQTMAEHGNDVIEYITECSGDMSHVYQSLAVKHPYTPSWGQLCVFFVSMAVELLAQEVLAEIG